MADITRFDKHPVGGTNDRLKVLAKLLDKFDPKSDLWTRITMYQGAPLPEEVSGVDDWSFPVLRESVG